LAQEQLGSSFLNCLCCLNPLKGFFFSEGKNQMPTLPTPEKGTVSEIENALSKPYNCILFNDENHSQEEVSSQIIKAIHCDPGKAEMIMLEAHVTGRAVVITASFERCEHVSAVLSEIKLGTKVEPA